MVSYVSYSNPGGAEKLTSGGEVTLARSQITSGSVGLSSGTVLFSYWTAVSTGTATAVTTGSGDTAGAGLTYAAAGIYSVAASGALTKLGDTGDLHASLWSGTFTDYTSTLTPSCARVQGQRYALAMLVTGVTPPTVRGVFPSFDQDSFTPLLCATLAGQTSLPASVAAGAVSAYFALAAGAVAP